MKRCPECGRKHEDSVFTCDCGCDLIGITPEEVKRRASGGHVAGSGSTSSSGLLALAGVLRFFAVLAAIGAVLQAVVNYRLFKSLGMGGMSAAVWVVNGCIIVVLLLSLAAALSALHYTEWQARANGKLLKQLLSDSGQRRDTG